ncbi:MAG: alginate export family protein [Gemmatimonadota bacterium]|jgi:hypothetical protein
MSTMPAYYGLALLALLAAPSASAPAQEDTRPSGLRIRAEHRTRVERLERDFRVSPADGLTAVVLRTVVAVDVGSPGLRAGVELADSRAWADDFAPLNTTHVNTFELLSAYVGSSRSGLLAPGDVASLRLGRLTLDRGGRRLVARNNFRNTINAFTGLDLAWTTPSRALRAFAVLPVRQRPSDAAALADNDARIDTENPDALFWGVHWESSVGGDGARVEAYVVGLSERDGEVASSNRRLVTPGVRLFRGDAPGRVDFELEAMLQVGTSRASSSASDVRDLSHRAFAGHASAGYRIQGAWSPRLVLQYDYASGDRNPGDGRNDRFDPLFGARAFELNATGFYGAFARSNISSPGVRLEAAPHARVDLMVDYRPYWLASDRDAWTTAGLRDATGDSGGFVGHQIEWRVRGRPIPGSVTLDVGGAALLRGGFAREAEGGRAGSAAWFYGQVAVTGAWR